MVEEGGKEETALGGCRGQGTRSQGAELDRLPRVMATACLSLVRRKRGTVRAGKVHVWDVSNVASSLSCLFFKVKPKWKSDQG